MEDQQLCGHIAHPLFVDVPVKYGNTLQLKFHRIQRLSVTCQFLITTLKIPIDFSRAYLSGCVNFATQASSYETGIDARSRRVYA